MYGTTEAIVRDHQHALLDEVDRNRAGNRLARLERLRHRADDVFRRFTRAAAQTN